MHHVDTIDMVRGEILSIVELFDSLQRSDRHIISGSAQFDSFAPTQGTSKNVGVWLLPEGNQGLLASCVQVHACLTNVQYMIVFCGISIG